jgi:hypothetical protein
MSASETVNNASGQQIGDLIDRIKSLESHQFSWKQYVTQVLKLLVEANCAMGGVVWKASVNGSVQPFVDINAQELLHGDQNLFAGEQVRLVKQVLERSEPRILTQHADKPSDEFPKTVFIFPAIDEFNDTSDSYVVQLYFAHRPDVTDQTNAFQTSLRLISFFKRQITKQSFGQMQSLINAADKLHQFQNAISASLEIKQTAFSIVNETRLFLSADRVTLATVNGRSAKVVAISGQDTFDQRSPVVRSIKAISQIVATTRSDLSFHGEMNDYPQAVQRIVQDYLDNSQCRSFVAIPLIENSEPLTSEKQSRQEPAPKQKVCGVLIVEQFRERMDETKLSTQLNAVRKSIESALHNATTYSHLFLMPLWRRIGRIPALFRGRTLPKTLLALGILAAISVLMLLVPADLKVKANGVIQPVQRKNIFARVDGNISKIHAGTGDFVKQGQLLLELENKELAKQIAESEGKLREAIEKHSNIKNQRLREFDPVKRSELAREQSIWETRITGYDQELEILYEKRAHLNVIAPFDGQVVTWNLEQLLDDRPVQTGQVLLTLARNDGAWEVELNMPERRMGHINRWIANTDDPHPEVSFVLSSEPRTVRYGRVKEIQPTALLDGTEGHSVKILVDLGNQAGSATEMAYRPGTTVVGHVHCGRTSFGYAKLNEAFQWVQRQYFAWF